jgi:hypothetical protein
MQTPRQKPNPRQNQPLPITNIPPFYRVRRHDLEVFLTRIYRLAGFDILKAAGAVPGVNPEYLVQGMIPETFQTDAARIRAGRPGKLALILEVLCVDGHIPPGHYIINTHRDPPPLEVYKRILRQHLDPMHPECIRFKERHRANSHFRKLARVIDRSLIEWLEKQPES